MKQKFNIAVVVIVPDGNLMISSLYVYTCCYFLIPSQNQCCKYKSSVQNIGRSRILQDNVLCSDFPLDCMNPWRNHFYKCRYSAQYSHHSNMVQNNGLDIPFQYYLESILVRTGIYLDQRIYHFYNHLRTSVGRRCLLLHSLVCKNIDSARCNHHRRIHRHSGTRKYLWRFL